MVIINIKRKSNSEVFSNDITTRPNTPSHDNTSDVKSWETTTVSISKPKTRRAKVEPVVINHIFKECADLIEDQTWKNIFNEASYGKFPRGFMYKDGFLIHRIKNKTCRIEINSQADVVLSECMAFFKLKGGIMSQNDQKKAREDFERHLIESGALYPTKWSEIKKKKIRDVLISTFVVRIAKEIDLNDEERKDLRNKIYLGMILGCFGNEQIELDKGYIASIAGLNFDETTRKFKIDYSRAPKQNKKSRVTEKASYPKSSFYSMWVKFLESLEKRAAKSGHTDTSSKDFPDDG